MNASESIIICEGFHDRSFLKGWLLELGCVDPSLGGVRVRDPWGKAVTGGQFGFLDSEGRFLRVVPANSDTRCFSIAEDLLTGRSTRPIRDLIVMVDSDDTPDSRVAACQNLVQRLGGEMPKTDTGVLEDGTRVRVVVLGEGSPAPGVPCLHCLERTVCSAIAEAYPERAAAVAAWLSSVGSSHTGSDQAKAHSWTYMAGWFPGFGCDAFYQEVWRDPKIRERLKKLLQASGAWASLQGLVEDNL